MTDGPFQDINMKFIVAVHKWLQQRKQVEKIKRKLNL